MFMYNALQVYPHTLNFNYTFWVDYNSFFGWINGVISIS